jgi:hypothetical protein
MAMAGEQLAQLFGGRRGRSQQGSRGALLALAQRR